MQKEKVSVFGTRAALLVLAGVLAWSPGVWSAAPGSVTDGLAVWLRAGSGIVAVDGEYVIQWVDESGNSRDAVWNPANSFGEFPPVFVASNPMVQGEATLRFYEHNALEIDLSWLAGIEYTIFVVNGRARGGLANFYISGSSAVANNNLVLGYEQPGLLRLSQFNNDLDAVVEPFFGVPVWSLDGFRLNQSEGRDIFHNGWNVASDDVTVPLASNSGSTIGHFRTFGDLFWFAGDIAEIVIYDRALSEDERLLVESDLAGRYGFSLSPDSYFSCNEASWKNHGEYASAIARAADILKKYGVAAAGDQSDLIAGRAATECGK